MEEYELIKVNYEMELNGKKYNLGNKNPFGHTPKIGKHILINN